MATAPQRSRTPRGAGRDSQARGADDERSAGRVAQFIERFDPSVARVIRRARAALRARWPAAHELVYDNYNALAIGYASTEKTSDVVVSLACYASGVSLYFMYGANLADPDRLLEGAGTRGRFVRLPTTATLADPRVDALLRRANDAARTPIPTAGEGRTIIKSVSAKQRPRRPAR